MKIYLIAATSIIAINTAYGRPISLKESIDLALERNLGLQIESANRSIAEEDLIIAESEFDARLNINSSLDERVSARAGDELEGSLRPESATRNNQISLVKRLKTGTEITQSTNLNRRSTNSEFQLLDPDYSAVFQVDVRQPLLSGRGEKVNLAAIRSASSRMAQSDLQWRDRVLDVISETERLYWALAYSYLRKELLESSQQVAEKLLDEAEKRLKMGAGTRLEVLQAKASLANRRSDAILADQEIESASDALRRGIGDLSLIQEVFEPSDIERTGSYDSTIEQLYADVLEWSLESHIQNEVIKQREFDQQAARNRISPRLDLALSGRYLGREEQGDIALESALRGNGYYWRGGVEFSLPWGMRSEKARYRRSKYMLDREKHRLEEIKQGILLDARDVYRDLEAAETRIEITELTVSLNEEQFEQERRRNEEGVSTFRNVLEAQEDLDQARMQRLEALRDANQALARLQSLDGSLLERHGFDWETVSSITN